MLKVGDSAFTDLLGTLLRFRKYVIVLVADIEKAFVNIGIYSDDRDALRFLWKDDTSNESSKLKILRFARVCFSLLRSMFHVKATIDHHLNQCL